MKFLVKHHRRFTQLAFLLFIGVAVVALSGCGAPTWLTDAGTIITLAGSSITAILSFIAGLTGNTALATALAAVSAIFTKVETGISDLETLVDQYNAAPDPTVLANIEAALVDIEANLVTDFGNLGLPASILSVIQGIAGLVLSQLQAWGTLITGIKSSAMSTFIIKTPYTKAEFKKLVNDYLSRPTGDPEVDAVLAKVKRIK